MTSGGCDYIFLTLGQTAYILCTASQRYGNAMCPPHRPFLKGMIILEQLLLLYCCCWAGEYSVISLFWLLRGAGGEESLPDLSGCWKAERTCLAFDEILPVLQAPPSYAHALRKSPWACRLDRGIRYRVSLLFLLPPHSCWSSSLPFPALRCDRPPLLLQWLPP